MASYLKDAHSEVKVFDVHGNYLRTCRPRASAPLPASAASAPTRKPFTPTPAYSTPATIYRYDLATGKSTVFRKPEVKFNPDDYETKQVFYTSKDGTRVPMFITCQKGPKLDGNNPTLLYGYGGFDISLTPAFSVGNLVWMEMGGVYAEANLRGGGEYGEPWHQAGTKLHKQNVFDDFIAAAEWLIANKYTQPAKLAIRAAATADCWSAPA